jgi:peptidyl-tRNA hydrolase
MKVGRGFNDLSMAKGKAKVQMSNNSAMICSKYSDITDTYQFLNKELIDASKEIDMKCQELSLLFHNFKK